MVVDIKMQVSNSVASGFISTGKQIALTFYNAKEMGELHP